MVVGGFRTTAPEPLFRRSFTLIHPVKSASLTITALALYEAQLKTPPGTSLTIRHAEVLNPDGSLHTENLRDAKATDYYTCRGDKTETWEPRFTFHGFGYAQISGAKSETAFRPRVHRAIMRRK